MTTLSRRGLVSVTEARKAIFGWWAPEGKNASSFNRLKRLRRRGWVGPKV